MELRKEYRNLLKTQALMQQTVDLANLKVKEQEEKVSILKFQHEAMQNAMIEKQKSLSEDNEQLENKVADL